MTRPMHPFHRTELLIGGEAYDRLTEARALVVGLGGVGSYAAEALVRSGIGHLTFVDFDRVCITNLNRQLHATRKTVRKSKVELMVARAKEINPRAEIVGKHTFYEPENADEILTGEFDIVLDCIDNMRSKVHLLTACVQRKIPVFSAMGAGGRLDPTRVNVSDIGVTHTDPFARIVRDNLRQAGITEGITAVWTDEPANAQDAEATANFRCICPNKDEKSKHSCESRFQIQGTVPWMPAIFGLTLAGAAVHHLLGREIQPPQKVKKVRTKSYNKLSKQHKEQLMREAGIQRSSS